MKKYITAALLFCAALTAACSKETAGSADTGDTGALEMRVSATRAEADGEYDPLQRLAVRIYRASGELLRQYTAETLPSRLELLAGEYRVEVDAGEAVPASFTKRFYKGEKTFTVAAGQTTVAEVECKRQNVVAEVKFDATVSAAFGENFHAWVVAADAFDEGQVQQGGVPALNYTADGTGYFTMPEGATTLTTRFEGTHPDRGVIVREARFGMPYQWTARPTALRLKYHATVGAVNKGTVTEEHEYIQDGQDRSRIFAVIVDWNSRHATVAGMGSPTGVWDPAKTAETAEGPVIAYGSLLIGETTPGDAMTTVEIPIEYYDRTTKPTGAYTLVISCTTSAYGDFKVGCLGNVMYVDDFEWVY